jgi:hypothetical protein
MSLEELNAKPLGDVFFPLDSSTSRRGGVAAEEPSA